jgi:N-acetylglucosaminyldiphosphoundecaprenol N-acetyl-beta-D-mannosaminyltransferase
MRIIHLKYFDFNFSGKNIDETTIDMMEKIKNGEKLYVLTVNSLIVYEYKKMEAYRNAVKKTNYHVPDGVGVLKPLKWIYKKQAPRITGVDLIYKICEYSSKEKDIPVFLLGTREEIIAEATNKLNNEYPDLKIAGYNNGFFSEKENDSIIEKINRSGARILFVGMGIPKQDLWISDNFQKFNINLVMGVGGSFDVISQRLKRAPDFYINHNLEWLYRTLQEPKKRIKVVPKIFSYSFLALKYVFKNKNKQGDE